MKLAKPRIDIGFATNNAEPCLDFWQNRIGLPFDYMQPIKRGHKQFRYDLLGSILKINRMFEPIVDRPPAGYRELLIAITGRRSIHDRFEHAIDLQDRAQQVVAKLLMSSLDRLHVVEREPYSVLPEI